MNNTDSILSHNSITNADIVCGLAWGDEAKGKVVCSVIENNREKYDWVCRWSGGSNAGHTIYLNGKKYVTHIVPAGIFYGIKSYIGPDCYVNIGDLIDELNYLKSNGFDTSLVHLSPLAHLITEEHKNEDLKNYKTQQGSTGKGIAPCGRDKYARIGTQVKDYIVLELFNALNPNILMDASNLSGYILCEGAQGVWLDINHGNYPYVTSSSTLPYSACSLGFPPQSICNIYGAAKIYDTRVGIDSLFPESLVQDAELKQIAEVGKEYGSTTNRMRRVNWLNLDKMIKAIKLTGTTCLVVSKLDILDKLTLFKLYYNNDLMEFETLIKMCEFLETTIKSRCKLIIKIVFSDSPNNFVGIN